MLLRIGAAFLAAAAISLILDEMRPHPNHAAASVSLPFFVAIAACGRIDRKGAWIAAAAATAMEIGAALWGGPPYHFAWVVVLAGAFAMAAYFSAPPAPPRESRKHWMTWVIRESAASSSPKSKGWPFAARAVSQE